MRMDPQRAAGSDHDRFCWALLSLRDNEHTRNQKRCHSSSISTWKISKHRAKWRYKTKKTKWKKRKQTQMVPFSLQRLNKKCKQEQNKNEQESLSSSFQVFFFPSSSFFCFHPLLQEIKNNYPAKELKKKNESWSKLMIPTTRKHESCPKSSLLPLLDSILGFLSLDSL